MSTRPAYFSTKVVAIVAALAGGAMLATDYAEARSGKGGSVGSRGSKTHDSAPATNTAPRAAQPIQKSMTQPGAAAAGTAAAATKATSGSMMRNLLIGGLIGAGLASMFGMGGTMAAVMGFILQMLLIAGIVMLAVMLFRRLRGGSSQPALAQATAGAAPQQAPQQNAYRAGAAGMGAAVPVVNITGDDFNTFERMLKEVQLGYANGDINALGDRVTPEMLSHFARELDENKRRGVSNDLSEPKLLQGDLAEAWAEPSGEYATVDMRYEIIDALVDQRTGRVIEGSTSEPQQVVERWTFRRPAGGNASQWELSAIQQAG